MLNQTNTKWPVKAELTKKKNNEMNLKLVTTFVRGINLEVWLRKKWNEEVGEEEEAPAPASFENEEENNRGERRRA